MCPTDKVTYNMIYLVFDYLTKCIELILLYFVSVSCVHTML